MTKILILYYSRHGSVFNMAQQIARGVHAVPNCEAVLRTVPPVSPDTQASAPAVPQDGAIYVSKTDLYDCDGLILGSPSYFGAMASPLKHFCETGTDAWLSGSLVGKPAGAFTSSTSMHGGVEQALFNMITLLMHQGALIVGLPYSETALSRTTGGGTPYGPSHFAGPDNNTTLDDAEIELCHALGKRIATIASTSN